MIPASEVLSREPIYVSPRELAQLLSDFLELFVHHAKRYRHFVHLDHENR